MEVFRRADATKKHIHAAHIYMGYTGEPRAPTELNITRRLTSAVWTREGDADRRRTAQERRDAQHSTATREQLSADPTHWCDGGSQCRAEPTRNVGAAATRRTRTVRTYSAWSSDSIALTQGDRKSVV